MIDLGRERDLHGQRGEESRLGRCGENGGGKDGRRDSEIKRMSEEEKEEKHDPFGIQRARLRRVRQRSPGQKKARWRRLGRCDGESERRWRADERVH